MLLFEMHSSKGTLINKAAKRMLTETAATLDKTEAHVEMSTFIDQINK